MTEEDFRKYETSYRQYYGSNYNKALRNLKNTKKRMQRHSSDNIRTLIWIDSSLTSSYQKPATLPGRVYRLKSTTANF